MTNETDIDFAVIGYPHSINLGDEVQSIAATRLLPRVDRYLPRESLHDVSSVKPLKLLCNGFFMYKPENWPPSDAISPLFVSMHVSEFNKAGVMTRPELKEYYQKFGPIGCRDKKTARLFQKNGHEAYFSGCCTLTLQNPFSEADRTDEILMVDPFYHFEDEAYSTFLEQRLVPASEHHRVHRVTHLLAPDHPYSEEEKIAKANELLDRYAKASLVITSRIHAALPCLAMGTPVLFIKNGYDRAYGMERFEGLMELFHVVDEDLIPFSSRKPLGKIQRALKLYRFSKVKPLPIDFKNPPKNKGLHLPLAAGIRKRVKEWIEAPVPV